jgi:hypothetical protein
MPPRHLARRVLDAHFDDEGQFNVPLPIPSVEIWDAGENGFALALSHLL